MADSRAAPGRQLLHESERSGIGGKAGGHQTERRGSGRCAERRRGARTTGAVTGTATGTGAGELGPGGAAHTAEVHNGTELQSNGSARAAATAGASPVSGEGRDARQTRG